MIPSVELHATCGAINLHSGDREQRQMRRVAQVLVHPGYSSKSLINDVAVLIVDPPFEMTEYVGPVCLPDPDQDIQEEGADLGLREDNNEEECDPIFEDCDDTEGDASEELGLRGGEDKLVIIYTQYIQM